MKTINVDRGFLCGHGTKFWKTINVDPRLFYGEEANSDLIGAN